MLLFLFAAQAAASIIPRLDGAHPPLPPHSPPRALHPAPHRRLPPRARSLPPPDPNQPTLISVPPSTDPQLDLPRALALVGVGVIVAFVLILLLASGRLRDDGPDAWEGEGGGAWEGERAWERERAWAAEEYAAPHLTGVACPPPEPSYGGPSVRRWRGAVWREVKGDNERTMACTLV
ncbi:unnamed protein product [Cutaneotrichosporon oleaginosum]